MYFVKNQQDIVLITDLAQLLEKFFTEMIIATFALYRFYKYACNTIT